MNDLSLFVSDLHGKVSRYEKFFHYIEHQNPGAVFIGGDILPSSILHSFRAGENKPDFVSDYLAHKFEILKKKLGENYPRVFIIMGNDDPKIEEETLIQYEKSQLWEYIHNKIVTLGEHQILGYSYVPPTPFLLKDWERYDIDHQVPPLCIHPTDGFLTTSKDNIDFQTTMRDDLSQLGSGIKEGNAICLFHSPPYNTGLDRIDMDGVSVDDRKMDVNVGSKAIREFIEQKKPFITLHGHIHESSRITGLWKELINQTTSLSAAYDGQGLAVVKFRLSDPMDAERIIL